MNIILYRIGSRDNEMDKHNELINTNIVDEITDYKLIGGANKTDLVLLVRKENGWTKEPNYAIIGEFGRKYFVESISVVNNNNYQLKLHCDVLTSFQQLLTTNQNKLYVERTSSPFGMNFYLEDNLLTTELKPITTDTPITTSYIVGTSNSAYLYNIALVTPKGT